MKEPLDLLLAQQPEEEQEAVDLDDVALEDTVAAAKAVVEESKDGEPAKKKMTPAELRLSKDFAEIEFPPQCSHAFPEEGNMLKLDVVFDMSKEGCLWKGGKYKF